MTRLRAALLLAGCAAALRAAPALAQGAPTVRQLAGAFIEAVDDAAKYRAIDQLSRTAPAQPGDIESLYDVFMRFPDAGVREGILRSVAQAKPGLPGAEALALRLVGDEDPASALFGLKVVEALKLRSAIPALRKIAGRKFKHSTSSKAETVTQRNEWSVQFEALAALARLDGGKALPLLLKRSREAPEVAALIGVYLWQEALPQIEKWSSSSDGDDRARAAAALQAGVPRAALRATRERLLRVLRDPKADSELRHQFAIKLGLSSEASEIAELLKAYEAAQDPYEKKLFATAAFASRDDQIVPLLTRFAKEDPSASTRAAARLQLKDMLKPADYKSVVQWAAEHDPDAENRAVAAKELKTL